MKKFFIEIHNVSVDGKPAALVVYAHNLAVQSDKLGVLLLDESGGTVVGRVSIVNGVKKITEVAP